MTPGTERLGLLMHDALRAIRKRFECHSGAYGLSSAQWRLLANLSREGRASQARLAELLEIEPISVSRLVDRMEQSGWVAREPDVNDRRVRIVVPTEKTLIAYAKIKATAEDVYADALNGLSDAERVALVTGLKAIIANLSDSDTTADCRQSETQS
ncbi:MAG: MarR family transcriptional regulator [Cereibacter sphaeroides]|uniref:MarR family transcriptional regulator n=1 Tax=Cereibacter sphaeroides TaxID=1063 RepID=A0A2W5SBU4_CERSP|nr:MAG: MarR family transcriptional regulator [Cereibacter sphaeroides]